MPNSTTTAEKNGYLIENYELEVALFWLSFSVTISILLVICMVCIRKSALCICKLDIPWWQVFLIVLIFIIFLVGSFIFGFILGSLGVSTGINLQVNK